MRKKGRLYLNKGEAGFENILLTTGVIEGEGVFGAAFGDYDNDGYLDILFEDLSAPSRLYRNKRTGEFAQANQMANLTVRDLAQSAAWADFNLDGRLDLFVNNDAGQNQLFKNLDRRSFADISGIAGVEAAGNSYGMAWGDFNNDGYPDVFIAPCSGSPENSIKHLLLNNRNETFTDINVAAGVNDSLASWGIVWLDYDNDNDLDIYITNTYHTPRPGFNRLYRNDGNNKFTNVTDFAGVAGDSTDNSFGVAAADFDNDGWLDIYVANDVAPHRLYRNNGNGTFTDIALIAGITEDRHIAVAVADFNHDGWLDIFTAGAPQNRLMLNNGGASHWIAVKGRGTSANYHGVGARVEAHIGSLRQIREITAGEGFCSQSHDLTAHFGAGANTRIDSIIVRWPGGKVDKIANVNVDQYMTVVEGLGINNPPQTFHLLEPVDGQVLNNPSTAVQFVWQPATDLESDLLSYRLHLSGPSLDTTFTDIRQTSFIVGAGFFRQDQICRWMVDVTDGYSVTASTEVFQFADAPCQPTQIFTRIAGHNIASFGGFPRGSNWGDYDNDGDPDLFIADNQGTNSLYSNNGDGTFTAVVNGDIVQDRDRSSGGSWGDYDNDGDLDLFVANFLENNALYRNHAGTFQKIIEGSIVQDGGASNGSGWADYDNDGDWDLFVANDLNENNALYANNGDGTFTKITAGEIVTDGGNSKGSGWEDFDNDGDLDLFAGNDGYSVLYANNGDGSFTKIITDIVVLNGAQSSSAGDYDNDGDVDLFAVGLYGENLLYTNLGNDNHWTNIKCVGTISNTSAIGTKVRIKAIINGKPVWQMREISTQTGYLSQSSLNAEIGLGNAETVDSLKIEWPSGLTEIYTNLPINRFIVATEGRGITGVEESRQDLPAKFTLSQNYPNPFNPSTTIRFSLPRAGVVQLQLYDLLGRLVRSLIDNETKPAGEHLIVWDGRNDAGRLVGSGVYFYTLKAGENVLIKKRMVMMK
jgi:hypothetical protein